MQISFPKPQCPLHHQSFLYICVAVNCPCSGRLCQECLRTHPPNSQYLKQLNFITKIEMQTSIIKNQYSFVKEPSQIGSLLNRHHQKVALVEDIMRAMQADRRKVANAVEEFAFSHGEVKKRLNKNKFNSYQHYMSSITSEGIAPIVVALSSQKGLDKVKKRLEMAKVSIKKYQEFIEAFDSYGTDPSSLLDTLQFKDKLLRTKIRDALELHEANRAALSPQKQMLSSPRLQASQPRPEGRKGALEHRMQVRLASRSPSRPPSKEKLPSQQAIPSPRRMIFGQRKRTQSESNKEN